MQLQPGDGPIDVVVAAEAGAAEEDDGGGCGLCEQRGGAGEVYAEAHAGVCGAEGCGCGAAEAVAEYRVRRGGEGGVDVERGELALHETDVGELLEHRVYVEDSCVDRLRYG